MSVANSRTALRHFKSPSLSRSPFRYASSSSETAQSQASSAISKATSSASSALSKAQASAAPTLKSAGTRVTGALGGIGGRTGRLIKFVESLVPPTVYYARVGIELSKLVFHAQKMTPPSVATFQQYLTPLTNSLRNPQSLLQISPSSILRQFRGLDSANLVTYSVIGAEVLGFFTVGTMIGRMKIVGYRGQHGHEEH